MTRFEAVWASVGAVAFLVALSPLLLLVIV